jgi:hypothetical protein
MVVQDPSRRLMNEYCKIALDLAARMADIEAAMTKKAALFNREAVFAVRDFARQGALQRGGSVFSQVTSTSPEQVAEELATSISRIDALSNKLKRGRFARDPLLQAGLSIRAACVG